MPRSVAAAAIAAAILLPVLAVGSSRAAGPTVEEIAAAAEEHGLTCAEPEVVGDGGVHLTCEREVDDPTTNIDLSVTYNAIEPDDPFAFATVAAYTTPPAPDWPELATAIALLFCEEQPDVVRQAVEEGAAEVALDGCTIRSSSDDFATTVEVQPRAAPSSTPLPAAADDLAAFLDAYGLSCTADGTECVLEVTDDEGLDATYTVTTRTEAAGAVVSIDAVVASLDASMPSDAFGFLRGVAERAPVEDPASLVTWLEAAIDDPEARSFESASWAAAFADTAIGDGRAWALTIVRPDAVASAEASVGAAPAIPRSAQPERSFVEAIPTPGEMATDPLVLLQSAALAALLVFLMPFPSQLFNSTLEAHEDEVRRWFRLDRLGPVAAGIGAFWASWPGVAAFTVVAALLYGFLDPVFGLNVASLATFLGMLAGIVLVTVAFALPVVWAHRGTDDVWRVKVVPVSLLVGIACVVLSRLTGFQPGYLYGLLIGFAFARQLSNAEEGRATAIAAGLMLAVALVAWLGLGALPDEDAFGLVAVRTSLAALMVAGLEGVVFGLLPMRFLPGETLYGWNRALWAALLVTGAFGFFHILINPASGYLSDTSRTPLLTVIALLVGFSAVSGAFWAWFRYRPEPKAPLDV